MIPLYKMMERWASFSSAVSIYNQNYELILKGVITDQYRYKMLRKFGSQLNIKNQLIHFPTVGQNKTKCKLNLEIKGKTISIMAELFFFWRGSMVVAM